MCDCDKLLMHEGDLSQFSAFVALMHEGDLSQFSAFVATTLNKIGTKSRKGSHSTLSL